MKWDLKEAWSVMFVLGFVVLLQNKTGHMIGWDSVFIGAGIWAICDSIKATYRSKRK